MDHNEILNELYGLERFGMKAGTATITELLRMTGDPHLAFPVVHVTGSNGKGSVCAYIESVLREAGYRTGLYTSPHLIRFNERIRVEGREISDEDVARLYALVKPFARDMAVKSKAKSATFFETTTAMAFKYFEERKVDIAMVEVGMGGEMDATNVVQPEVCVVTRIGLEHTDHLGKSVKRIAREKSGIIKTGSSVVTLEQEGVGVIEETAGSRGCSLTVVGRDVTYERLDGSLGGQRIRYFGPPPMVYETALLGAHQAENLAVALATVSALEKRGWSIDEGAKRRGVSRMRWPARFQVVQRSPYVIIDGAHNPVGAQSLRSCIEENFPGKKVVLVAGVLADKDLSGMAKAFAPVTGYLVATRSKSERAFASEEVAKAFKDLGVECETVGEVSSAIAKAMDHASTERPVVVSGSLYTAGEALEYFRKGRR